MERLKPGDPEQIGPWQIVNRLGSGGMGIVYLGTDGINSAAIKTVRAHLLEDPTSRTRLEREVNSLRKVKSGYVAEIVGANINDAPAWIATRFIDGPSLKVIVEKNGPLKPKDWEKLAIGLASALNSIHSNGIIHRDIKPSNILISAEGPQLIDFGISFSNEATSLTKTGLIAGTPAWLAPEQFENRELTNAVDDFALGSVLYFAATGNAPWGDEDSSIAQVMRKILNAEPDLKLLPQSQLSIISGLIEKDPKKRLNSKDVLNFLKIDDLPAKPISNLPQDKISKNINLRVLAAGLVIIIGISSFFIFKNKKTEKSIIQKPESNNSQSASPSSSNISAGTWRGKFDGDSNFQTGKSNDYSLFVCDQNVDQASLKVIPNEVGIATKVVSSGTVCGKGFDTIYVTGKVPSNGSKTYSLIGKTKNGLVIKYKYSILRT